MAQLSLHIQQNRKFNYISFSGKFNLNNYMRVFSCFHTIQINFPELFAIHTSKLQIYFHKIFHISLEFSNSENHSSFPTELFVYLAWLNAKILLFFLWNNRIFWSMKMFFWSDIAWGNLLDMEILLKRCIIFCCAPFDHRILVQVKPYFPSQEYM